MFMIHQQRGIGLIEVLVALLILAVSILGFSAMQMQSVKSTIESVDRSQTLLLMRSLAEKIRANPSAINTYTTTLHQVKANTFTEPSKLCVPTVATGTTTASDGVCTPAELASADVWRIKQQLDDTDLKMDLQPCPSAGGGSASNIMYSYCLITSWDKTTPTIGSDDDPSDGSMDCLTSAVTATDPTKSTTGGTYHPKATCMFMEMN